MRTRHEKHRSGIEKPWTHQGGWRGKGFRRHAKLGPLLSPSIDRLAKQGASGKGGEQRSSPLTPHAASSRQPSCPRRELCVSLHLSAMDIADGKFSLPMPVLLHVATARAVVSRGVSPPAGSPPPALVGCGPEAPDGE